MHVIGTAGHVDHGKSALVRALTGTNPDRWLEEQRRGMTLDLGFAHLRFDDGTEAGIVDVPGHERFLHNMLAGAAGMELVLLVIAANEGAKPQTLEHLAILRYLHVRRTLIVLTKTDTVTADERAFVQELVREELAGTIAADATILPVSSVTGEGLAELRTEIHAALAALPPHAPQAPAYLPIDRVFALAGHGTIVTGTLMQGSVAIGDTLALSPLGRSVRVRSLQVFGAARERVDGGTRVALNLPGVETTEIARGAVLASPQFGALARFNVRFAPLAAALPLLKRRTPVRAYIGSAEILGTLVFERVSTTAADAAAQLYLRSPTVAFPGAPFVVRRLSPKTLLGGGVITAEGAATGDEDEDDAELGAALAALRAAGLGGATPAQVGAAANLREDRARELLTALIEDGRALPLAKPVAFVDAGVAGELCARAVERLRAGQHERPWRMGLTSIALAGALAVAEATLVRVLTAFVDDGSLAYRAGTYATPDFVPAIAAEQRAFFDRTFPAGADDPSAPVVAADLVAAMKTSKIAGVSEAFETLLCGGALVKVGEFVYRGSQIAGFRTALERALRGNGRLTVSEFRTLTGTSRKYAVPLLEFFDATGVTLRSGDVRVLRSPAPNHPA